MAAEQAAARVRATRAAERMDSSRSQGPTPPMMRGPSHLSSPLTAGRPLGSSAGPTPPALRRPSVTPTAQQSSMTIPNVRSTAATPPAASPVMLRERPASARAYVPPSASSRSRQLAADHGVLPGLSGRRGSADATTELFAQISPQGEPTQLFGLGDASSMPMDWLSGSSLESAAIPAEQSAELLSPDSSFWSNAALEAAMLPLDWMVQSSHDDLDQKGYMAERVASKTPGKLRPVREANHDE